MKDFIPFRFLCIFLVVLVTLQCRFNTASNSINLDQIITSDTIVSPLGKKLTPATPPDIYIEKYKEAKANFQANPSDLENIIWYGRRTAYLGNYKEAIDIFSNGIIQYPEEPRLYRHRGHRYISIRDFNKAINDLRKAAKLIEGKENQIEQDGLPNALNLPISTLHGNIWYHLGLAYYLARELDKAFDAYTKGRETGENDDNTVSTTHWLYMIQRRMGNDQLATQQLEPIHQNMKIIENYSYYNLCRFYKGLIPRDSLLDKSGSPSGDAVRYGLANWDLHNSDLDAAKQEFLDILSSSSWSSFGYIAAEQDYIEFFQ